MQVLKISLYLSAFVLSNFIVLWYGAKGLIFTSLFLIPFDFVMRCMFHEQWKGKQLIIKLGLLVATASLLTYLINHDSKNIAVASMCGFITAQIMAGLYYQYVIDAEYWVKVNGSDLIGIVCDSIIFQLIAFGTLNYSVMLGQILLKFIGGIVWYYVLFIKTNIGKIDNQ